MKRNSIGRHTWRCKSKINSQDEGNHDNETVKNDSIDDDIPEVQVKNASITNCDNVLCACGKSFKG